MTWSLRLIQDSVSCNSMIFHLTLEMLIYLLSEAPNGNIFQNVKSTWGHDSVKHTLLMYV